MAPGTKNICSSDTFYSWRDTASSWCHSNGGGAYSSNSRGELV